MTDKPLTYRELFETLKQHGVGSELIAERLGIGTNSLHHFKKRDSADPGDLRYQKLARLARACRAVYGKAS